MNLRNTFACRWRITSYLTNVEHSYQFAPIKNKEGKDSKQSALNLLTNMWKKRIGGDVNMDGVEILDVEEWEGNEERIREEVWRRVGEGEKIITVWKREWD